MKEFKTLSEFIEDIHDHDKKDNNIMTSMIPTKKVKEFIKILKEEIDKHQNCTRYVTIDKHLCVNEIRNKVNKSAGDKLR